METKVCRKCGTEKPLNEFWKRSATKDGLYTCCKACEKPAHYERCKKYIKSEKGQKRLKRFRRTEHAKLLQKRWRTSEKGKQYEKSQWPLKRIIYRKQKGAVRAVGNAVRRNKLPKAKDVKCYCCNGQAEHWHHYQGYEKENWLKVIPVCYRCHMLIHYPF